MLKQVNDVGRVVLGCGVLRICNPSLDMPLTGIRSLPVSGRNTLEINKHIGLSKGNQCKSPVTKRRKSRFSKLCMSERISQNQWTTGCSSLNSPPYIVRIRNSDKSPMHRKVCMHRCALDYTSFTLTDISSSTN